MSIIIRELIFIILLVYMALNSYQDLTIHDQNFSGKGDSSVFLVAYPDGHNECRKEYIPEISRAQLDLYHNFHNTISKKPITLPVRMKLGDVFVKNISFKVLALGQDIVQASRIDDKQEISVSTVPYVGGKMISGLSNMPGFNATTFAKAQKDYINQLTQSYPMINTKRLQQELCPSNMKYEIEGSTLKITITDMCCNIGKYHESYKEASPLFDPKKLLA